MIVDRETGEIEMTNLNTNTSQHKAARVAGFVYLFTMATAIFAGLYVPSKLIIPGNVAETANSIMASEQLFRIGAAFDLITFTTLVLLPLALYVLLKPVNKNLALLGLFWRLGETFILGINTLNSYIVLHLLSGADYLKVFEIDQLQALAQLFLNAQSTGYNIGLIFLGLGGVVFSYLLLKSNYIPTILAGWGIFSYLVLLISMFASLVLLTPPETLEYISFVPVTIFEVIGGFWLLFKGVKIQPQDNHTLASV